MSTSQSPPPFGAVLVECFQVAPPFLVYQYCTVEPSPLPPGVQMMPCRPSGAHANEGSPYDGPVPMPTVVTPRGPNAFVRSPVTAPEDGSAAATRAAATGAASQSERRMGNEPPEGPFPP